MSALGSSPSNRAGGPQRVSNIPPLGVDESDSVHALGNNANSLQPVYLLHLFRRGEQSDLLARAGRIPAAEIVDCKDRQRACRCASTQPIALAGSGIRSGQCCR